MLLSHVTQGGEVPLLAVLFELAAVVNREKSPQAAGLLKALGAILGLLQSNPSGYLQTGTGENNKLNNAQIEDLITQRNVAKIAKNYAEADRIRKALLEQGVTLKDSATGTSWAAVH